MNPPKYSMYPVQIIFPKGAGLEAIGRNGRMKAQGVEVFDVGTHVELAPVTTRGVGNGCVPLAKDRRVLEEMIRVLTAILEGLPNEQQ